MATGTKPTVVLITGSTEITQELFTAKYEAPLRILIADELEHGSTEVVLGTANGVDTLALKFLIAEGYPPKKITRWYKGSPPADAVNDSEMMWGDHVINYRAGFKSYPERDAAMRAVSTTTIGFPMTYGGGGSGTTENLLWAAADNNGMVHVTKAIAIGRNTCDGFDPRVQSALYSESMRPRLMEFLREHFPPQSSN